MSKENGGSNKMQILAALTANIPTLTYGIQIGWLSPMGPLLMSAESPAVEPLAESHISWMAAALTISACPSVPLFSYLADRFGRKKSILLLSLLSAICWILKLSAINPAGLICARVFAGMAAAGSFLVIPVYVREISKDSLRGALGSFLMLMCNVGVLLVYIMGMSLSYYVNQAVYLVICGAHMGLFMFMPESPAFLVKIGDQTEAAKAIGWLRSIDEDDEEIKNELKKLQTEEENVKSMPRVTIQSIVKEPAVFKAVRISFILIATQTLCGCFAVINYAATIFERTGGEWSSNTLALMVGALQLTGTLLATALVERSGRKILLSSSCAVVCLCMVGIATVFLFDYLHLSPLPQWLPVVSVSLCIFAYGIGLAPIPFIVMAELFSFQLRARLTGIIMMLSWLASSVTVLLFAPVANACGEHVVFCSFALVAFGGGVYSLFIPETRGMSLEEIQGELRGGGGGAIPLRCRVVRDD